MPKATRNINSGGEQYSNKVFQTLACLQDGERKRLHKFLRSPYFVQSRTLTTLFEAFNVEIEKGKTGFDRQKIWHKIAVGEEYDDVNFRKYCSDLLRHTQNFMAHEILSDDLLKRAINSFEYIVDHKIELLYGTVNRESRELLKNIPYRSIGHFKTAYLIERQYFSMMEYDVKVDKRANLEEISQNLDLFYWIEKLKIASSALSQRKTGNQEYNISFLEEVRAFLNKYPLESVPELSIYYHSYLTLYDEENVQHYYNLKQLLDKFSSIMPQHEAIELTDYALHYCADKMNKGQRIFLQEYFDLFETTLAKGLFFQKGVLASWRFNNMVGVALRLGKLDWAEKFIKNYHIYLSPETKDNTYSFNLARVYRFQGKYENVLKILHNIEYEDTGYNLISKAMLIITYFELQEYDILVSFTTSFKTYLNRHKDISKPRRQGYLNLIKYTRKLMKLPPADKAAAAKLREEITREKATIINHEWLLEKL